jgi:putrescine transport system permease protein
MITGRFGWRDATVLTLVFSFLYLPILIVVIFSFNDSRLVTVWGGFSTRWYAGLASNAPMLEAAWLTLRIGLVSATLATVLGVLAAVALTRMGRFRGRGLLGLLVVAPIITPEIIMGLSLLLLFVAVGMDRGFWTIVIAHTTFAMCFVTVIVQARLMTLDISLEEAAMDLGCTPLSAFFKVTAPMIASSVLAGFLLALTLSLVDLVIASFVSGPGATTLPMRIYGQARLGVTPEINAISTILIGSVSAGVIVASLCLKRDVAARLGRPT